MKGLQQWVAGIVSFLIFVTVVQNLLPSKMYEKYIRLFTGMVLVLLVIRPLLAGLRLEDQLAYSFDSISFKNQAKDLNKEILGMEQKRLWQLIDAYEQAAEQDVEQMAEDAGLEVQQIRIRIDSDSASDTYGMVTEVFLKVSEQKTMEKAKGDDRAAAFVKVDPVRIGEEIGETVMESAGSTDVEGVGRNERIARLRRKVEQYYGLESSQVKIECSR